MSITTAEGFRVSTYTDITEIKASETALRESRERLQIRVAELQDVQELSNFFERRVSAYQVAVAGSVSFDEDF